MTAPVVLVTDYAWPDLDIERELLHPVGARVVVGAGLAPEAVAVMTSVTDVQRRTAAVVKQCLAGEVPPNVVNPAVLDSPRLRLDRR